MKTDDLKIFLHLAQSLNFSRTAKDCYLSPSTLTRMIQRIEEDLGCLLFHRTNKQVSLTAEGLRFESFATQTLSEWGQLKLDCSKTSLKIKGTLSLFCSVTAAYSVLPALLDQYRARYPQVRIDLEVGNSRLAPQKLPQKDLIIAALPQGSDLQQIRLATTSLVFVAKTKKALSSFEEGFSLIVPQKGRIQATAKQWLDSNHRPLSSLQAVEGSEAVLALVALGCGVGIVPQLVLDKSPLLNELHILKESKQLGSLEVCLAREIKPLSPAAQTLWEMAVIQAVEP